MLLRSYHESATSESESCAGVNDAGSCGDVSLAAMASKILDTFAAVFADDSTNSMPLLRTQKASRNQPACILRLLQARVDPPTAATS